MAFAVSSLESLALKRQELATAGKIPHAASLARRKIVTRADAVAALREAVERKLGTALADPEKISTATVQDIKRCLDLVAELEAGLPKGIRKRKRAESAACPAIWPRTSIRRWVSRGINERGQYPLALPASLGGGHGPRARLGKEPSYRGLVLRGVPVRHGSGQKP